MSFKGFFSIFSSGRHFVQPSRAILVILVIGKEYFCANILKSGHWPRTRCHLKTYFLALAAILFNGAEPLLLSWIFDRHNFCLFQSRSHPVAKEQVLAQSNLRFEKRFRKLIFKMVAVVAILDFLSAHLAILCLISALMLIIKFGFN